MGGYEAVDVACVTFAVQDCVVIAAIQGALRGNYDERLANGRWSRTEDVVMKKKERRRKRRKDVEEDDEIGRAHV